MSTPFILPPPSSVPGPYSAPSRPPVNGPGVATPHIARWHVVQPGETLWKIAQRYYRTPGEWVRIFNANRESVTRPDGSLGTLISTEIHTAERLHIP